MPSNVTTLAKRAKPTKVASHWSTLLEGLQFSSQEFYVKVEKALQIRQVPDLKVARVDWKEGGALSARREYLRLQRERLVFDICAAPFGTGFFVSEWVGERPLRLLWALFALIVGVAAAAIAWIDILRRIFAVFMWRTFRIPFHTTVPSLEVIAVVGILAGSLWLVIQGDNALIAMPVVGPLYERYVRKVTYYRVDLQCMYKAAVHAAVLEVIDDITKAKGIAPLSEFERRPAMDALAGRARKGGNGRG